MVITLMQNSIGQSKDITRECMYEKIFRKEYEEMMKIWVIFAFLTSISVEKITILSELRKKTPK